MGLGGVFLGRANYILKACSITQITVLSTVEEIGCFEKLNILS